MSFFKFYNKSMRWIFLIFLMKYNIMKPINWVKFFMIKFLVSGF